MSRILVTGAAGFTGRYLAPLLMSEGHEVHGLALRQPSAAETQVHHWHGADLADFDSVSAVVRSVRPDQVVHLAAIAFVGHGNVAELYQTNIVGTRHLLDALAASAHRPRSVLLASSANIYGNAHEGIIDEEVPPAPANDYGVSKFAMELVAQMYADRLPITIVRPFNYTGRGQSEAFLIPKIVAHARDRRPIIELGNIDVARDFSDVRTIVDAYARILREPAAVGKRFNVCSGKGVTLREVLAQVEALSDYRFELRINSAFVRRFEVQTLFGSSASLESEIGPLKSIPLGDTLKWMLDA